MYTIKQAAARTGVSVPVLRAWERRYGIVAPSRTAAGYRVYDEAALDRIATMRTLVEDGWTPANAARAILSGEAPPRPTAPAAAPSPPPAAEATDAAALRIERFVRAAAELDAAGLERVLDEMFASGTFERVAEIEVLPALQALGDGWAAGRVSVAGEHAASQAVQRRLAAAFQAAGVAPSGPGAVLVGLPPGGRHELAALAFAVLARRRGLPVLFLGPDLPVADWVSTAAATRARAAVVGAVAGDDGRAAVAVARALLEDRPGIVVAFGGAAAPDPRRELPAPLQERALRLPERLSDAAEALEAALRRRR